MRKMDWRTILIWTGFVMMMPGSASGSFHCGNEIVEVGDTSVEVLQKFGEPDFRELLGFTENGGYLKIERWRYDLGSTRLMRILLLEGGIFTDIDKGEYGGD
jgi:hypothetical protein